MAPEGLRRRRAAAQLLQPRTAHPPVEIVRALLAVQAQDLGAARLALRARAKDLSAAAVDAALTSERSLVVAWLARGTLHLVAADDHGWLLGLTAPAQEAGARRRLGQLGVSPDQAERAVRVVEQALAADGPQTRAELAGRLKAARLPAQGQAVPHLLAVAARRGLTVLGPVREDGAQAFALTRDWLGAAPALPLVGERRDAALAGWPTAGWRRTGRRAPPTSQLGRAWRCATRAPGWPGWPAGRQAATSSTSNATGVRRGGSPLGCSAPSTPTCWAGRTAPSPSRPSTRRPCTPVAASCARSPRPTGRSWAPGRCAAGAATSPSAWSRSPSRRRRCAGRSPRRRLDRFEGAPQRFG